jgi:hypothetical protein
MFKFESLEVWKAAVELYSIVVSTTEGLYRRNRVYLADQIRRAPSPLAQTSQRVPAALDRGSRSSSSTLPRDPYMRSSA